jgi:hypothetical protein
VLIVVKNNRFLRIIALVYGQKKDAIFPLRVNFYQEWLPFFLIKSKDLIRKKGIHSAFSFYRRADGSLFYIKAQNHKNTIFFVI